MNASLSKDSTQHLEHRPEKARREARKARARRAKPDTPSPQEGAQANNESPDPDTGP